MYVAGSLLFQSFIIVVLFRLFNITTYDMWQLPMYTALTFVVAILIISLLYGLMVFIRMATVDEFQKRYGWDHEVVIGTFVRPDNVALLHTLDGYATYYLENGRTLYKREDD